MNETHRSLIVIAVRPKWIKIKSWQFIKLNWFLFVCHWRRSGFSWPFSSFVFWLQSLCLTNCVVIRLRTEIYSRLDAKQKDLCLWRMPNFSTFLAFLQALNHCCLCSVSVSISDSSKLGMSTKFHKQKITPRNRIERIKYVVYIWPMCDRCRFQTYKHSQQHFC